MEVEDNEEVLLRPEVPKDIKPGPDAVDIASPNRMDGGIIKELEAEGKGLKDNLTVRSTHSTASSSISFFSEASSGSRRRANGASRGIMTQSKGVDDDIPWEGVHLLNPNEKVQHAKRFKEEGTNYFKNNKFELAAAKYQKVVDFLSIDEEDEESYGPDKEERKDLLRSCQLNLSMCYIKLGKWMQAKDTCTKIIEEKCDNIVKAWFRRGEANFGLKDFENAKADFEKTLKLEPKNKAAMNKLVLCQQVVKAEKEEEKVNEMYAIEAKLTSFESQTSKGSVLFVEGFEQVDWMADKMLGNHLEDLSSPDEESRARKAWQGFKIDRCSKISDCVRKISSGQYKAIVVVDLSYNHELFENELGGVLQSFVQAGGVVGFPTSEGLQLAGTLRRLFNTTWEESNYYRSMWDVSRENSDTVTEFFGDVSLLQDLPFSAKVASVKNVPQHEQCFRIMPGAKTQSHVFFMAGGDVGPEDVCVAVHKYGSGSIAFFGDVNCETETVQLVAAYVRTCVDGQSN